MGHVSAADVEEPGNRVGGRKHSRIDRLLGELACEHLALIERVPAGVREGMRHHRGDGRRGLAGPDRVDRVLLAGDETPARLGRGGGISLAIDGGVKPGIVAEGPAFSELLRDPIRRRLLDQVMELVELASHLSARLKRITPVDEHRRLLRQHNRGTGGAGEAREPGEALGARRDILALVLVAARHDEAGKPAPRELGAQQRQALGVGRRARGRSQALGPHFGRERQELSLERGTRFRRDELEPGAPILGHGCGNDACDKGAHGSDVAADSL